MARLPRFDLPGHLHLVLQRASEAQPAFLDDEDRRRYLAAMLQATRECPVAVHAYALSDDQVLILATQNEPRGLAGFMQAVGRRYVKAFNGRHGRRGSPWIGRYRATIVDASTELSRALRFVEQAPVRAGLAARSIDWPWSSAAHHAGLRRDAIVSEHAGYWQFGNTPFEREARYLHEAVVPLALDEAARLMDAVAHAWPIGSDGFLKGLADDSGRRVKRQSRGRPTSRRD